MHVRTGFVTQVGMEYERAFAVGADLGLDYVELMLDGANAYRNLDPAAVRSAATEHDLDLAVHLPFTLDVGSPHDHVREGARRELEAAIDAAAAFDAEKAVVHAGSNAWQPAWDGETVRANVVDTLAALSSFGDERDVELCVENVPGNWFGLDDFDRLFAETGASMTLDTGHARIAGLDSAETAAFVADHADRISHFHLNDTRRPRDEHLPFGSGTIDFAEIFGALPDDWTGTLSLEVFTLEYDYLETSVRHLDDLL
jgi:sugar phosphate isomerase/epimerase